MNENTRTNIFIGSIIAAVIVFIMLLVGIVHYKIFDPNAGMIPGKLNAFDPVKSLPEIQDFAGKDSILISISASYVKPDGTMDLKAKYLPQVTYIFYRPIHEVYKPESDLPAGIIENKIVTYDAETIIVFIRKPGYSHPTVNGVETTERDTGMTKHCTKEAKDVYKDRTVKGPPLSFKQIWELAIKNDAPQDAVAFITYDISGYKFSILYTPYNFKFDLNGDLINSK